MRLSRQQRQTRRHQRHRKRIKGTGERPRLATHRSLRHIYAQVIDDEAGVTLASATTAKKESRESGGKNSSNIESAKAVGAEIARRAREKGVTRVVFDCGGGSYHGAVKALAEAAREAGLEF